MNTLLVARKMKLAREMYFAILLDRKTAGPMMIGCSEVCTLGVEGAQGCDFCVGGACGAWTGLFGGVELSSRCAGAQRLKPYTKKARAPADLEIGRIGVAMLI